MLAREVFLEGRWQGPLHPFTLPQGDEERNDWVLVLDTSDPKARGDSLNARDEYALRSESVVIFREVMGHEDEG